MLHRLWLRRSLPCSAVWKLVVTVKAASEVKLGVLVMDTFLYVVNRVTYCFSMISFSVLGIARAEFLTSTFRVRRQESEKPNFMTKLVQTHISFVSCATKCNIISSTTSNSMINQL